MKRLAAVLVLLAGLVVICGMAAATREATTDDKCDCPREDFAKHGDWQVLVNKEMSSFDHPTAGPFGFAKSMTLCMAFDQTNKGYPADMKLVAEGSIDGFFWFPLTLAGSRNRAEAVNECLQVTPTRFVRVEWQAPAQVPSPGPRVNASVQVGY